MKKICSLMFVFTLIIIGGLITNVDAVSLSNTDGRITVTRQVTKVHNPVTNTFKYAVKAYPNNPKAVTGVPSTFNIVLCSIFWFSVIFIIMHIYIIRLIKLIS